MKLVTNMSRNTWLSSIELASAPSRMQRSSAPRLQGRRDGESLEQTKRGKEQIEVKLKRTLAALKNAEMQPNDSVRVLKGKRRHGKETRSSCAGCREREEEEEGTILT